MDTGSGASELQKAQDFDNVCQHLVLDWDYRQSVLVKNIKEQNPDVVFMQEVDRYRELKDAVKQETPKLRGFHVPKSNSTSKYLSVARLWKTALDSPNAAE